MGLSPPDEGGLKPTLQRNSENYEYACGVLFMMIVPPYFILYDQTLWPCRW